jgi:hypothetical protein
MLGSPAKRGRSVMKPPERLDRDALKVRVKRIMLNNPDISVPEIMDELDGQGLSPRRTTVMNIRNEFRHSLRFLQAEGYLTADLSKDPPDRA